MIENITMPERRLKMKKAGKCLSFFALGLIMLLSLAACGEKNRNLYLPCLSLQKQITRKETYPIHHTMTFLIKVSYILLTLK